MSEQNVSEGIPRSEVILKPVDLARSYLGYEGAKLIREIAKTENSIHFYQTYRPTEHISRAMPKEFEIGGMDYSDWQNECLAAEENPGDNDILVENGNQELNYLESDLEQNCREFGQVLHGDNVLIDKFSKLEVSRRAELEKAKKR